MERLGLIGFGMEGLPECREGLDGQCLGASLRVNGLQGHGGNCGCGRNTGGAEVIGERLALLGKGLADFYASIGLPLIEAYGLTETSPAACINPINLPEFNGSIGLPISSTDCAIRNDSGADVPLGERGELCIRGPQVMKGYYKQPEETANVFMPDGFLRTGDVAVMDDKGFVRIVDRKKDMILVSGFNVYPNEVEDVVTLHPGVLEVAAVGVPDERSGEAVKIFVVKKDPSLTAAQLIAHCRELLTAYKIPSQVEFRADLPKTNVGKILRRELRDPS